MEDEFVPLQVFENNLHYWWLILLLGILGAAGGWLLNRVQPPIFESIATISTSIDYRQTGRLYDYEENRALGMLGQVIESKEVLDQVIIRVKAQNINLNIQELKQKITLERRDSAWLLRVRDPDPKTAFQLADTWGNVAYQVLLSAHDHAVQAQLIEKYLEGLTNCLEQTAASLPAQPICGVHNLTELEQELSSVQPRLDIEVQASQGIIPALLFSYLQPANLPEKPVLRAQNTMVLAGAFIGMLLGIVCLSLRILPKVFHPVSHG